jgi:hypothetical protein
MTCRMSCLDRLLYDAGECEIIGYGRQAAIGITRFGQELWGCLK